MQLQDLKRKFANWIKQKHHIINFSDITTDISMKVTPDIIIYEATHTVLYNIHVSLG